MKSILSPSLICACKVSTTNDKDAISKKTYFIGQDFRFWEIKNQLIVYINKQNIGKTQTFSYQREENTSSNWPPSELRIQ